MAAVPASPQPIHSRLDIREFTPGTSLLSVSRLSLANSRHDLFSANTHVNPQEKATQAATVDQISSPSASEDGNNFHCSLQIDMKDLVGDAVGNMCISPTSRDIVLAARRGLFIIDLEAPLEIPRYLPQGSCWEVTCVGWNPHPGRAQYIASTSSEKLMIWNLLLGGKSSVEHILQAHTRAITDIHWHTSEPDLVATTGIDSWQWIWDLRACQKPIFGFCSFDGPGSHVRWNRNDPYLLGSSHHEHVVIWDCRKGSLPLTKIKAHKAKIYGIDWSCSRRNEIVTCSLDKSIKVWDIEASPSWQGLPEPKTTICTTYPVWRARDLPFGCGVLSIPQRGETALDMWSYSDESHPVHSFEGHTDVVKEFVWRLGGTDVCEFQLISWSTDRTLRFWPIDTSIMQRIGQETMQRPPLVNKEGNITYRDPPKGMELPPLLTAPIRHHNNLAEALTMPPAPFMNPVLQPHRGSAARALHEKGIGDVKPESGMSKLLPAHQTATRPWFHGRVNAGWKVAPMEPLAWLASVKVGDKRDGSSGAASRTDSRTGSQSRLRSRSSRSCERDNRRPPSSFRRGSQSRSRVKEERREEEGGQTLQEEITSSISKLSAYKIKLEKHDLARKRSCTLGLHGPWGEFSSVYMRISFTFPRDYPHASHPHGTPTVELERSPLVSVKTHAFILRRLRAIREQRRPCLEPCLRFLLLGRESEVSEISEMDSGSSEDENLPGSRKPRSQMASDARVSQSLGEPRTSQGVFSPNGELVYFFRALPRITRIPLRDTSTSSKKTQSLRSPALVSEAVSRLRSFSVGRQSNSSESKSTDRRVGDGQHILRVMTNLFTHSRPKFGTDLDVKHVDDTTTHSSITHRRSVVYIASNLDCAIASRMPATEYVFKSDTPANVCRQNAIVARRYGRFDHERVFRMLQAVFTGCEKSSITMFSNMSLIQMLTLRLYSELSLKRDLQMLAMLSTVCLHACQLGFEIYPKPLEENPGQARVSGNDYFSLLRSHDTKVHPVHSPDWPRLPSGPVTAPANPAQLSSSLSYLNPSRGSWSTLFNTESMRHFVDRVHDSLKDGLGTPTETHNRPPSRGAGPISVPKIEPVRRPSSSQRHPGIKGSSLPAVSSVSENSWSDVAAVALRKPTFSVPNAGHVPPPTLPQVICSRTPIDETQAIIFEKPRDGHEYESLPFDNQMLVQFVCHIHAYAETLFCWQLHAKRLELLKSIDQSFRILMPSTMRPSSRLHDIGINRVCWNCKSDVLHNFNGCTSCTLPAPKPRCSVCRLPIKGLSRTCLKCLHISHYECWKMHQLSACPQGCGCVCQSSPAIR